MGLPKRLLFYIIPLLAVSSLFAQNQIVSSSAGDGSANTFIAALNAINSGTGGAVSFISSANDIGLSLPLPALTQSVTIQTANTTFISAASGTDLQILSTNDFSFAQAATLYFFGGSGTVGTDNSLDTGTTGGTGSDGGGAALTAVSSTIGSFTQLRFLGVAGGGGGSGGTGASGGNGGAGGSVGVTLGTLTTQSGSSLILDGGLGGYCGDGNDSSFGPYGNGGNGGDVSVTIGTLTMNGGGIIAPNGGSGANGTNGGNGGQVSFQAGAVTLGNADQMVLVGGLGGLSLGGGTGGNGGSVGVTIGSMNLGVSSLFNAGGGGGGGNGGQVGNGAVSVTSLTMGVSSIFGVGGFSGSANLGAVTMSTGSTLEVAGNNSAGLTVAILIGTGSVTVAGGNIQLTNGLFNGAITGGTLTVLGGSFTENGSATLTDGTSLSNAILVVGDNIHPGAVWGGPVTVSSTSTLMGFGTLSGSVTNNGAVEPGLAANGTLTVGSFSQGGSGTLDLDLMPAQSGRLVVTGAAQWGGTLDLTAVLGPDNLIRYRYDLLNVGGAVSGSFAVTQFSSLPVFLNPVWSGNSNAATLTLYRTGVDFASFAGTKNGTAVGTAMDLSIPTSTDDFIAKISELYFLPSGQGALLDQMGGVIYTALPSVMLDSLQFEDDLLFSRLSQGDAGGANSMKASLVGNLLSAEVPGPTGNVGQLVRSNDLSPSAGRPGGFWLENADSFGSVNATAEVTGFNQSNVGFLAGYDGNLSPSFTAGIMGGYLQTNVTSSDSTATAAVDGVQFGVYGRKALGNFGINLLGGYVIDHFSVTRNIALGPDANQLIGIYNGSQINSALQLDYRIVDVDTVIKPVLGIQYAHLSENAFTETGSDSINLSIPAQFYDSLKPYLGLGEKWSFSLGKGAKLVPEVHASVSQELINTSATQIQTAFQGAAADPFTVTGTTPDATILGVGGGVELNFNRAIDLFAYYNGYFSGSQSLNTIFGGVNLSL